MPFFECVATGSSINFTVALYFPSLSQLLTRPTTVGTGDGNILMIRWTVIKIANSGPDTGSNRTGKSWQSATYFSTLPNGCIPDDGVDFFKQFLDHLRTRWLQICQQGEELLSDSVCTYAPKPGWVWLPC